MPKMLNDQLDIFIGLNNEVYYGCFTAMQTLKWCPEQYDVYFLGTKIGYMRLRSGLFETHYLQCDGELSDDNEDIIYECSDLKYGGGNEFENNHIRFYHMRKGFEALANFLLIKSGYR